MTTGSAAYAFKFNAFTAASTLWAGTAVQVLPGAPAVYQGNELVEFGTVTAKQDFAAFGTSRSREETLDLEVTFSVFQGGGSDAEWIVAARCYQLANQFAEYVRVTDTTLGGAVRDCFMTSTAYTSGEPNTTAQGRFGMLEAHFEAHQRITS